MADAAVKAVTDPFANLSESIKGWLSSLAKDTNLDYFADNTLTSVVLFVLLVHFTAYVLENNTNIQGWSKPVTQSLHELRIWTQTVVAKYTLYFAFGLLGVGVGYSTRTFADAFALFTPYVKLLAFVYILNKVCVILTCQKNPEYSAVSGLSTATAALSMTKGKWLYIIVSWLQTVTDILIQQASTSIIYGFAVGKALSYIGK